MSTANGATNTTKLDASSVGQSVNLDGFGGKITRHDGVETSMKDLVEKSGAGVVVFTYPKASTPGCKLPPPIDCSWMAVRLTFAYQAQPKHVCSETPMHPSPELHLRSMA
jgi:hypothetical protein